MMDRDQVIQFVNTEISGKLCWNAIQSHGSVFSFEIGNSRVDQKNSFKTEFYNKGHGEFTIFVTYSIWAIFDNDNRIILSSSDKAEYIKNNIKLIDGHKFKNIEIFDQKIGIEFYSGHYLELEASEDYDLNDELLTIFCRKQGRAIVLYQNLIEIEPLSEENRLAAEGEGG